MIRKIISANNIRQGQKKTNQQQVAFNDVVETHEFEPINSNSEDIVGDFLRLPFKYPKEGYSLSVRSASCLGAYDLVEHFIMEDATCVNVPNKHGWTPLMYAAQSGHVDVCQLLLQHGARVDAKNEKGMNAYELAKSWNHNRVMELVKVEQVRARTCSSRKAAKYDTK